MPGQDGTRPQQATLARPDRPHLERRGAAFLVVSTDEQHMVRHREWISKTSLPAEVMLIKPLWKT
jgi:hypothetical protein